MRKFVLFTLLFVLAICKITYVDPARYLQESNNFPPFLDSISENTRAISVFWNHTELKIPRNYLVSCDNITKIPFFILVMVLPDLRGVDQSSLEMFKYLVRRAAWWNFAPANIIWLQNESSISSARKSWIEPTVIEAKKKMENKNEYGLIRTPGGFLGGENFTFVSDDGTNDIVIKCESAKNYGKCYVEFDLAPGFVMQYGYDRSQLSNWKGIDRSVRALLISFLER